MKLQYLGTAAAEGWPALFCKCEACEKARRLGGKDIRTRSQSIVDDRLLLDLPADTYLHVLKFGVDLPSIEHILITHSHEDHFYPLDMILKAPPYAQRSESVKAIRVYGNSVVIDMLRKTMAASGIGDVGDYIIPTEIHPFETFRAGDYEVTAYLGQHIPGENCYIYGIEHGGSRLLYAHDTGLFPEETWEHLKGVRFDAVSLDCTCQLDATTGGHMGLPNDITVRDRLVQIGCADKNTKFVINHFSHNGKVCHEDLVRAAGEKGFITSYDGMSIKV